MPLRAPTRRSVTVDAVRPNAGLQMLYRRKIEALTDAMHKSVEYWIRAAYRANAPEIAQDASPASLLQQVIRRLMRKWQKKFDEAAPELARYFATAVHRRTDNQLRAILKKSGFSVGFKMTREYNDVMQATVGEQVGLIRTIPQKYLSEVQGAVMRSVATGRDVATLQKDILKTYGVTKRRAALIARDQNNKATATLTRVRQDGLGIVEAEWLHSHGGKEPRPEHLAFSGKRYIIAKGAYLEGKWVWPGTEINCRCVSRSIIPGLE